MVLDCRACKCVILGGRLNDWFNPIQVKAGPKGQFLRMGASQCEAPFFIIASKYRRCYSAWFKFCHLHPITHLISLLPSRNRRFQASIPHTSVAQSDKPHFLFDYFLDHSINIISIHLHV